MTSLRVPRPGGVTIDVSIPLWLVLLVRMSIALGLLAILGLILVSFLILAATDRGDGDGISTGPAISVIGGDFSSRPLEYTVSLTAGSEGADDLDKEWTLLLSSGNVHWANIVEGPKELAAGETGTFVLTFLFEPQPQAGEPVALRWDPGRKVTVSVPLGSP